MASRRQTTRSPATRPQRLEKTLEAFANRLRQAEAWRGGAIRLQLTGAEGGSWCIEGGRPDVRLVRGTGSEEPVAVVMGEASALRAVLEGKKEGRAAFLAGGIRVRGDISYLQKISAELGTHSKS